MKLRPITAKDFEFIIDLDKKVYPLSGLITKKVISQWFVRNPEYGMIFEDEGKIVGVCIIIPLNREGWEKMVKGKLFEFEVREKDIFKDNEIGLHFCHIEKLTDIKNFTKLCFDDLRNILGNKKVIGMSAVCVSKSGLALFKDKFNFKEREYKFDEHILEKNGKKIIADGTEEEVRKKYSDYTYHNRCELVILYPNEKSLAWEYLK